MEKNTKKTQPVKEPKNNYGILSIAGIAFIIAIVLFGGFWTSVPAGHIGIQDTFGNVSPNALDAGFYIKEPWRSIVPMSYQTQKIETDAAAASSDLQDVKTQIVINYHINKESAVTIYKNYGLGYADKIISQSIQESVKANTALFTAEELITRRETVKNGIQATLSKKLVEYSIILENVNITNFSFSDSFNQAIEAKVTAEQRALEAKNKLEQIKIEKEQTITQAEAEAASIRLKADAEAYQLQVIQEQLLKSPNLIQYNSVNKWDGVLPQVTGGVVPFIDIEPNSVGDGQ